MKACYVSTTTSRKHSRDLHIQSLAFLATLVPAIAGPVKHGKLHQHYPRFVFANTTSPAVAIGTGYVGDQLSPSIVPTSSPAVVPSADAVQNAVSSAAAAAPAPNAATPLSIIGSTGPTVTAFVDSTEIETKTITYTTTSTIGSGESAVTNTITSISYETVEVIIRYVTVYVTDHITVTVGGQAASSAPATSALVQAAYAGDTPAAAPAQVAGSSATADASDGDSDDSDDSGDLDDDSYAATNTAVYTTTITTVEAGSTVTSTVIYADATASSGNGTSSFSFVSPNILHPKTRTRTRTRTAAKKASTTPLASSTAATVPAPAQTGAGTVSGCTKWYVAKSGDYCSLVAGEFGISTLTFEAWNPSVGSSCLTMYAGWAYCVATLDSSSTLSMPTSSTTAASSTTSAAVSFSNAGPGKVKSSASAPSSYAQSTLITTSSYSPASTTTSSPASVASNLAPTGTGTVSGCTQWYTAVSGDYCSKIATQFGISTATFIAWNPSVGSQCLTLYAGYRYCVAAPSSGASASYAAPSGSPAATTSGYASSPTTSTPPAGDYSYVFYQGDGTVGQGWPSMSSWVDFNTMWSLNVPTISISCGQFGVPNNSEEETQDVYNAIQQVSSSSGVDPRFILAIIMQESKGCVRAPTTSWSVKNPGLMQDYNGQSSCNPGAPGTGASLALVPCPQSQILGMITDGTEGTPDYGLVQDLAAAQVTDVSRYYKAARIYNGGLTSFNTNNLGTGCCTLCYASDVANRLRGWTTAPSSCNL